MTISWVKLCDNGCARQISSYSQNSISDGRHYLTIALLSCLEMNMVKYESMYDWLDNQTMGSEVPIKPSVLETNGQYVISSDMVSVL